MSTIQTNIPKEVDTVCKNLIESFTNAIEYLEEVRSGKIEQDGNLNYLLHDWSINHFEYNDELQSWWNVLGKYFNEVHPDTPFFSIPAGSGVANRSL